MSASARSIHVPAAGAGPARLRVPTFVVVVVSSLATAVAILVPVAPASASTTYVVRQHDSRCSDGGPGSSTKPFCTISAAADVADAGDTVRVGAGVYREQVTAPSGVRFVASSSAAQVVGSDSLASASWSSAGGHAWSTLLGATSTVSGVLSGSTRLTPATSVDRTGTGSWFLDPSTHRLYVDLGGPEPGAGDALAASVRQYGFLVRGVHDVTVQGFTIRDQGGAGILLDGSLRSVVRDVSVSGSASYGINDQHGTQDRIIGAHVRSNVSIGIRLLDTSSSSVTSSVSTRNGFHGISVQGGSGAHVARNTTSGNLTPGVRRAAGIDISSSSLHAVVERNISHDNDDSGIEIFTGSEGAVVRRNVSRDNGDHGIDVFRSAKATLVSNTSVGNSTAGLNVEGGSSGTRLRNNISVNNAVRTTRSKGDVRVDASSVSGTSIDRDLAFQSNGTTPLFEWGGVVYRRLAGLRKATNQEKHGLAANPRFVALGSRNLELRAASPALDVADSSAPGWAARDQTGARPVDAPGVRNRGVGPVRYADLGALERTPPTARLHLAHRVLRVGRPERADGSASTGTAHSHIVRYRFRCGTQPATRWQRERATTCTFHRAGRVRVTLWVRSNLGLVDRDIRWVPVRRR
jgi:hypothetical protein